MCLEGYDPCQDDLGRLKIFEAEKIRRRKNLSNFMGIYLFYPPSRKKRKRISISGNLPAPEESLTNKN